MRPAAIAASALAPLALICAGPASAQASGQSGYGQSGYSQSGYGQANYGQSGERPEAAEQGDPSQDLVRQLNLRSDQRAAFRDYQSAFQAQNQADQGQDEVSRLGAMTTPQRLDDSARQMDRDRADFERVAGATRRFYATLDPGQKRTFDRLTAPQAEPQDDGAQGQDDRDDDGPPAPRR